MQNKGLLIVLSGPSGAGKGTIISELCQKDKYSLSISATTRNPRKGEIDGKHYFFKTKQEFKKMIQNNQLLEYAEFCENYYGTPIDYVKKKLEDGKNVLLEIEVQGALQVKKVYEDAVLIFVMPPSILHLKQRLEHRNTESQEIIQKRLETAKNEIKVIYKYDYIVINNVFEQALQEIEQIVENEKLKRKNINLLIQDFLKEK